MQNYFEVTVKYKKTAENGKVVKISEKYLADALSFTEAEARINEEMKPFISGEFVVSAIKRARINEIFENVKFEGDRYFKAKVNFITKNEEKSVEKKTASYMLVRASNIKEAREALVYGMKGTMADYEVEAITETKIIDVFNYKMD